MKKTALSLVLAAFVFGCCGCGGEKAKENPSLKDMGKQAGEAVKEGKEAAKEAEKASK